MCMVNPSHISKTFSYATLQEVVNTITFKSGMLLEIVNYIVEVCDQMTKDCKLI